MSGHSKWSTIKRKKEIRDAKKGQVFTKMAKLIVLASREGSDPETNFKLKLVIDEARKHNVPQENINRAIQKGDSSENNRMEQISYEAYGPSGVAFVVEVVTDNKKRIAPELRKIFADYGGRLVKNGSVLWLFEKKAVIRMRISENKPFLAEDLILKAIDCGAEDILQEKDELLVFVKPSDLKKIKECLEKAELKINSANIELRARNLIEIKDKEALSRIDKLIDALKNNEDVLEVYVNVKIV